MTNELKPVPCGCGGEAIVHEQEYGEFEVYCPRCFITTDDYATKSEAIEAWNKAMGTDIRTLMKVFAYDAMCAVCKKKKKADSKGGRSGKAECVQML